MAAPRALSYAVDIVFCIDVTGSMSPIIDQVKANALRFYDDVQSNLTAKGKNVDQLRVRVIAFRDFVADGAAALAESPFFTLPGERASFQTLSAVSSRKEVAMLQNQDWRLWRWRLTRRGPLPGIAAGRSLWCGLTSLRSHSTHRCFLPTCPRGCRPTSAP
jgi:hypothetical protein